MTLLKFPQLIMKVDCGVFIHSRKRERERERERGGGGGVAFSGTYGKIHHSILMCGY